MPRALKDLPFRILLWLFAEMLLPILATAASVIFCYHFSRDIDGALRILAGGDIVLAALVLLVGVSIDAFYFLEQFRLNAPQGTHHAVTQLNRTKKRLQFQAVGTVAIGLLVVFGYCYLKVSECTALEPILNKWQAGAAIMAATWLFAHSIIIQSTCLTFVRQLEKCGISPVWLS